VVKTGKGQGGFLLIEVLVALAIFGLCATMLVSGTFNVMRFLREFEDTRERDQDLQFVRSEVLSFADREKLEEGGEIETLSLGTVEWEMEDLESTDILDVYQVTLRFEWSQTDEMESGDREVSAFVLRPTWSTNEFQLDRQNLLEEKQRKIREMVEDHNWR
jgi:prepilin-type N-terminal cleavage/methylation domain-containing protein